MRASPLIEYSSTVLILCLWIGAITCVFSSLIGLFQQDIKKVIAYSTMSQLAQEYITHLNIFRHQTIYEKIILIIYIILYIASAIIFKVAYLCSYFLLLVNFYFMLLHIKFSNTFNYNYSDKAYFSSDLQDKIKLHCIKNLNPYYITGFVDGEGCFLINIPARSDVKLGYNVNLVFKLKIHSRDIELLTSIRDYLGNIGNITTRKDGYIEFIVSSKKDIEVLIKHFDTYPLITQK
jgi:multisubunit Na+/H+ antiporter MnhF subunit